MNVQTSDKTACAARDNVYYPLNVNLIERPAAMGRSTFATGKTAPITSDSCGAVGKPKASATDEQIASGLSEAQPYMIWSPEGIDPPRARFSSHKAAFANAHHMAKRHPGQSFHVIKIKSRAIVCDAALATPTTREDVTP